MRRLITLAALALGVGLLMASVTSSSTRVADATSNGGGGDYQIACALWAASDGTGYSVTLCGFEYNQVPYSNYGSPTLQTPQSVVVWQNSCGTLVNCVPYSHETAMSPTDMAVNPVSATATLSDDVNGCQLSFDLQATPASPTDGFFAGPSGSVWPDEPSIAGGAAVERINDATGTGSVCSEPLSQGRASGILFRADGAGVEYQNSTSQLPELKAPFDVHGTVTNEAGQPIAGASVTDGNVTVQTGSDGTYNLNDDLVSVITYLDAYGNGYGTAQKSVTIIDEQQPVNFVLPPAD